MTSIEKLDKNFEVKALVEGSLVFFNCLEPPFRVHGLMSTPEGFIRLPSDTADKVNLKVSILARSTAGGRVRFRTDSPQIAIRAKMKNVARMPHFAITGTAGFDLYEGNTYRGTFVPPYDVQDGYESTQYVYGSAMREYTIHFPLYSEVVSLEIGLCDGSSLLPARDYRTQLPVVFYGSSITQGGCASRPGNSYDNIISRDLDCDHVNLGFSGGALGEDAMARYIAGLSMSALVYDYDHNAPSPEYLADTHGKMFRTIRAENPLLPVVMITRPQPNPSRDDYLRRAVVMSTYLDALKAGDENVYFVDGTMLLHQFGGDSGTVDACHPNDLGFMCMAKGIGTVLARILS